MTILSSNCRNFNFIGISQKEYEDMQAEIASLKEQLSEHKEYCCCAKNEVLLLEINRLRKAINSALNFMACPDDLSELTGKFNDQAAFDVLREALNNESEE